MVAELSNTARWIIGITFWLSLILYTGSKFEDVATNGRCLPEIQSKITWKYSARVEIPTCASMSVIIRFTNIYSDSYPRLRYYFWIFCRIKLWSRIRAQLCRYIKYLKSLGSYVFVEGLGQCFLELGRSNQNSNCAWQPGRKMSRTFKTDENFNSSWKNLIALLLKIYSYYISRHPKHS